MGSFALEEPEPKEEHQTSAEVRGDAAVASWAARGVPGSSKRCGMGDSAEQDSMSQPCCGGGDDDDDDVGRSEDQGGAGCRLGCSGLAVGQGAPWPSRGWRTVSAPTTEEGGLGCGPEEHVKAPGQDETLAWAERGERSFGTPEQAPHEKGEGEEGKRTAAG